MNPSERITAAMEKYDQIEEDAYQAECKALDHERNAAVYRAAAAYLRDRLRDAQNELDIAKTQG